MNEERTTLEKLVAAGAAAVDGLTPSYAVIRNALSDGTPSTCTAPSGT